MKNTLIFLSFSISAACNSQNNSDKSFDQHNNASDNLNSKLYKLDTMDYYKELESTKKYYPFEKWRLNYFPESDDPESEGMLQYTQENCDQARDIFNNLIDSLQLIGKDAGDNDKLKLFKSAVLSLNMLNGKISGFIETGEREDLCNLIDQISIVAGLEPNDYAKGEGIADLWREW